MIFAVQELVVARVHIDLAMLTIQRFPRGSEVLAIIASRLTTERYRSRDFLRHLLMNSTFWQHPNGTTYYLGVDEIPPLYRNEAEMMVDKRLTGFYGSLDKLEASLDRETPGPAIVSEVSEMMRKHMPNQNITTNIHVTNSQIGVLNTGSIQDVHAIDASITALKSKGDIDVGDAFKKITEGVMSDETISEAAKAVEYEISRRSSCKEAGRAEPECHKERFALGLGRN